MRTALFAFLILLVSAGLPLAGDLGRTTHRTRP